MEGGGYSEHDIATWSTNKLWLSFQTHHYISILRTNTVTRIEGGQGIVRMILVHGKQQCDCHIYTSAKIGALRAPYLFLLGCVKQRLYVLIHVERTTAP